MTNPDKIRLLKLIGASTTIVFLLIGLGYLWAAINNWYENHRFVFKSPVEVRFNRPISVEEKKIETGAMIRIIETIPAPEDLIDDIDKYIYRVFGIGHYRMAIAVSKCEGYYHPADGFNVNNNGSIDVGKMRINSINFKIPGCSLQEAADPYKNIECGYKIWDRGDGEEGNKKGNFNAWVGFKNGCALTKYE